MSRNWAREPAITRQFEAITEVLIHRVDMRPDVSTGPFSKLHVRIKPFGINIADVIRTLFNVNANDAPWPFL